MLTHNDTHTHTHSHTYYIIYIYIYRYIIEFCLYNVLQLSIVVHLYRLAGVAGSE